VISSSTDAGMSMYSGLPSWVATVAIMFSSRKSLESPTTASGTRSWS